MRSLLSFPRECCVAFKIRLRPRDETGTLIASAPRINEQQSQERPPLNRHLWLAVRIGFRTEAIQNIRIAHYSCLAHLSSAKRGLVVLDLRSRAHSLSTVIRPATGNMSVWTIANVDLLVSVEFFGTIVGVPPSASDQTDRS